MLRIIAGTLGSRKIEAPKGSSTRPTTDRVREAVFSKVQFLIPGARVLDLFAGSGAVGIEAVSRGAKEVICVDKSRECCKLILNNLEKLSVKNIQVFNLDYQDALYRLRGQTFDFIYLDPPYSTVPLNDVFDAIDANGINFDILAAECRTLPNKKPAQAAAEELRVYGKIKILYYEGKGGLA